MNQESKIECYRKAYQTLKQMAGVRNLGYPEEKKDLEFSCDIGRFHINYNLRLNIDFITIRAGKVYKGKTDEELDQIGRELSEGQTFSYTGYDQKLYLQLSLPMAGIADEDAKKRIDEETLKFFQFLMETEGVSLEEAEEVIEEDEPEEEKPSGVFTEPDQEETAGIPVEETASGLNSEQRKKELEWIAKLQKENVEKSDALKSRESGLDEREKKLEKQQKALEEQISEVKAREEEAASKFSEAEEEKKKNASWQEQLSLMEEEMKKQEEVNTKEQLQLKEREEALQSKEQEVQEALSQIDDQKEELSKWESQVVDKESNLTEREKLIKEKNAILEEKEKMLDERNRSLSQREQELKETISQLEQEDQRLSEKMEALDEKDAEVQKKLLEADTVEKLEKELQESQEQLNQERDALTVEKEAIQNDLESLQICHQKKVEELDQLEKEKKLLEEDLTQCRQELETVKQERDESKTLLTEEKAAKEQAEIVHSSQITELQKTLEERKQEVEESNRKLSQTQSNLRAAKEEIAELQQDLEEQKGKEKRLRTSLTQKAAEQEQERELISNLQDQLAEYKKQTEHNGTPDEVLKDFAETRKENRMLKREMQDMEMEAKVNETVLLDKIKALQEQQETAVKEAQDREMELLPEKQAEKIIQELKTSGINLNPEEVNGHLYLRGTKEGCQILFDVEHRIVSVEKEIRKAYKFSDEAAKWNEEDLTESYILEKNRLICRKQVTDVTMDVNKVLRKILILK